MRSMLKRVVTLSAAAVVITVQAGCEGAGTGSYLSIGTGNTGGIYYPFGGALASRLTALDSARQYTAEVTGASVENIKRLELNQIDLGFSISTTILSAYEGRTVQFPDPVPGLRIIAPLWPNPVNIMVPAGAGIETFGDVRGRRMSVGSAGSGTEQVSRLLLGAWGMSYDDVQERFLTFSEAGAGIRDGSLDLANIHVAYPASAVLEATTTGDATIIPLEGPEVDALIDEHPQFYRFEIPSGVYRGVDEAVPTVAELNWIVAREDLDPEIVTMVLDILQQERERLIQVNEIVRQIDLQNLARAPIPLHPAAEAWMQEHLSTTAGN